jgi:hypothetical protein
MAPTQGKINCPFCSRELDDSKEPYIQCRFCGKKFRRLDIFNDDEKSMRQSLIIDLSTEMSKLRITKNVASVIGTLCLLCAVIILFAEEALLVHWLLIAFFVLLTIVWWVVSFINGMKYNQNQSKLFDLSGGRRID